MVRCPNYAKVVFLQSQLRILSHTREVYAAVLSKLIDGADENTELVDIEDATLCKLNQADAEHTMFNQKFLRIIVKSCQDCHLACEYAAFFPPSEGGTQNE